MTFVEALRGAPIAAFLLLAPVALAAQRAPASRAPGQQANQLAALNALQPGLWELSERNGARRSLCVASPSTFLRLRHAGADCSSLVITNEATRVTVQYSCPGAGWGRTTVQTYSPQSARIDTQGIANSAPFAFVSEARRVGECDARTASIAR